MTYEIGQGHKDILEQKNYKCSWISSPTLFSSKMKVYHEWRIRLFTCALMTSASLQYDHHCSFPRQSQSLCELSYDKILSVTKAPSPIPNPFQNHFPEVRQYPSGFRPMNSFPILMTSCDVRDKVFLVCL